ncbi:MAG TPA: FUSC family protein [Mycobacteriales bacterium]
MRGGFARAVLHPRGLLHRRPTDAAFAPAVRASLAQAVPLIAVGVLGRLDLAPAAGLGAFAGLYGRDEPYRSRAVTLAGMGAIQVLGVLVGTLVALSPQRHLLAIPAVAIFAGLTTLYCDAVRTGPPAGLFPAYACAIAAFLPATPGDVAIRTGLAAAAAALAWGIGMAGWLVVPQGPQRLGAARALEAVAAALRTGGDAAVVRVAARHRAALGLARAWNALDAAPARGADGVARLAAWVARAETAFRLAPAGTPTGRHDAGALTAAARRLRARGPVPAVTAPSPAEAGEVAGLLLERQLADGDLRLGRLRPTRRAAARAALTPGSPSFRLGVRVAVAAALAGACAVALGLGHAYWAPLTAVAVLQAATTAATLQRTVQRAVGTGVGIGVGAAVLSGAHSPWVLIGALIVAQLAAELLMPVNYGLAMLAVTPLALALVALATPSTTGVLVGDRLLDTAIGAVAGLACAVVLRDRRGRDRLAAAVANVRVRTAEVGPDSGAAELRRLAVALVDLRERYDVAAAEPWPDALPAEEVLDAERGGHEALAAALTGHGTRTR